MQEMLNRAVDAGVTLYPTISAAEFDRRSDLPPDDPESDVEAFIDHTKNRRPGREVQRVNVDFPVDMLAAIDREAQRLGVTRQSFIKIRIADAITKTP